MHKTKADPDEGWDILDHPWVSAGHYFDISASGGVGIEDSGHTVPLKLRFLFDHIFAGRPSIWPDHPAVSAGYEKQRADAKHSDPENIGR